jgi:hypothetical protein
MWRSFTAGKRTRVLKLPRKHWKTIIFASVVHGTGHGLIRNTVTRKEPKKRNKNSTLQPPNGKTHRKNIIKHEEKGGRFIRMQKTAIGSITEEGD